MENLEVKTAEFEMEPEMRCSGMCKGSCSCPTGHCRCGVMEKYSSRSDDTAYVFEPSDSYEFKQAA